MGLIYWWCRFASHVPDLANAVTQWPGISTFAKWLGGVAPQRRLPSFARQTFTARHRHRKSGNEGRPRSEEHTSELQSLMRISYAVFCLKKKKKVHQRQPRNTT